MSERAKLVAVVGAVALAWTMGGIAWATILVVYITWRYGLWVPGWSYRRLFWDHHHE